MITPLTPTPSSARAAAVLSEVFSPLRTAPFAFRLWDGSEVRFGDGPPVCTTVIKSPETFVRLIRNPSPYAFAEAYINSDVDLEGDLFATMELANVVEELQLSPARKLRILLSLWARR